MGTEGTEGGLLAQWIWAEAGAAQDPWEEPQELAAPSWLCGGQSVAIGRVPSQSVSSPGK